MALRATQKRAPPGIEPFWEKPRADPPLKCEKWHMQAKLALLAKNIALDTLLEPKPENIQLPRLTNHLRRSTLTLDYQPIYESTITGSSVQSERERLGRKAKLKMNWDDQCQKQMEIGIMCGGKSWTQAERKTVYMLYLSVGTEARRIVCRNPYLKMDILTTVELWQIMEDTFIRPRNITFDRYMLLITKQSKGESIDDIFGKLRELSKNCDLGNQEDTLIRDLFIVNMQAPEIQSELIRETFEPA